MSNQEGTRQEYKKAWKDKNFNIAETLKNHPKRQFEALKRKFAPKTDAQSLSSGETIQKHRVGLVSFLSSIIFSIGAGFIFWLYFPSVLRFLLPPMPHSWRHFITLPIALIISYLAFLVSPLELKTVGEDSDLKDKKRNSRKFAAAFLFSTLFFVFTSFSYLIQPVYALIASVWIWTIAYLFFDSTLDFVSSLFKKFLKIGKKDKPDIDLFGASDQKLLEAVSNLDYKNNQSSKTDREVLEQKLDEVETDFQELQNRIKVVEDKYKQEVLENEQLRSTIDNPRYNEEKTEIILEFLSVLDNLYLAINSSRKEDAFVEGLKLIVKEVENRLKQVGVTEVNSVNFIFDPNVHEAVDKIPVDDDADGIITVEYLKGFYLGDKLLRPARVQVGCVLKPVKNRIK